MTVSNPIIETHAELVWCLPFWINAVHQPIPRQMREDQFRRLAALLNENAASFGVTDWSIDNDFMSGAEPYRIAARTKVRLQAKAAPPQAILNYLKAAADRAGLGDGFKAECPSAEVRYNEYGLGTIECRIRFGFFGSQPDDDHPHVYRRWVDFLTDPAVWASFCKYANDLLEDQYPIVDWNGLQKAFAGCLKELDIGLPAFDEFMRTVGQGGLSWVNGCNLLLFRRPDFEIAGDQSVAMTKAVALLDDIAKGFNRHTGIQSSAKYFDTANGHLDALCHGLIIVALVCEPQAVKDQPLRPSNRLRALWRYVHLNYAFLTVATDALQAVIETTLRPRTRAEMAELFTRYRDVTTLLSLVKENTNPVFYESDDLEVMVYNDLFDVWGLKGADAALTTALDDANIATSRLREAVSQSEERYLNRIGLVIAVLGAIGTLQAVLALYGIEANMHEDAPLRYAVLGVYISGTVAFLIYLSFAKWIRSWIIAPLWAKGRRLTHRIARLFAGGS